MTAQNGEPAQVQLFNMRTGMTDILTEMPDDFSDYIPQVDVAQDLYKELVEGGMAPYEAAAAVSMAAIDATEGNVDGPDEADEPEA